MITAVHCKTRIHRTIPLHSSLRRRFQLSPRTPSPMFSQSFNFKAWWSAKRKIFADVHPVGGDDDNSSPFTGALSSGLNYYSTLDLFLLFSAARFHNWAPWCVTPVSVASLQGGLCAGWYWLTFLAWAFPGLGLVASPGFSSSGFPSARLIVRWRSMLGASLDKLIFPIASFYVHQWLWLNKALLFGKSFGLLRVINID